MSDITIRKAVPEDLPALMALYAEARRFMAEAGNPRQWGATNWPPEALIREDIAAGRCYAAVRYGAVVGVFAYLYGKDPEPAYAAIAEGAWRASGPYGVVHRIAGRGCGRACLDWAFAQCGHLRIDTHPDNRPMRRLLEKCGFVPCGIIHVPQDTEARIAYEKGG